MMSLSLTRNRYIGYHSRAGKDDKSIMPENISVGFQRRKTTTKIKTTRGNLKSPKQLNLKDISASMLV